MERIALMGHDEKASSGSEDTGDLLCGNPRSLQVLKYCVGDEALKPTGPF